ncbi:hypothetical protein ACHAW5_003495 [Stephanodiscus triporus]|uniref:PPIase cyclophilin-type domain-containing protein n=1 Tax=Stephanodiscus triporus TaxID=2934178 RepID=A0ABD3NIA8_9STRA
MVSIINYDLGGKRYYVSIGPGNEFGETFIVLAGKIEGILVRCDLSVNSRERMDRLDILVKPYWAHRGASHFLDLVREGYYDGVVFHRMVPNLLTQFGIARDYNARTKARKNTIRDDRALGIKFEPGYLSFAGNGVNSRTTEVFVVNPGVSEADLKEFGKNSWERPFGFIVGDVNNSAISNVYSGYGDMFPFGNGPDSNKIYDVDGYTTYIPQEFPKLDYIDRCYIVDEVRLGNGMSNGEL